MPTDSFTRALDELDPILRALVELSLRQGLDDADIADMLGRAPDEVAREREEVLRELAVTVAPHATDADLPELEDAIRAAIEHDEPAVETVPGGYDGDDRRETDKLGAYILPSALDDARAAAEQPAWLTQPEYEPRQRERKRRSRLKLLLPLLIVVAIVAVVGVGVQLSGDNDDSPTAATPAPQPKQADAPKPATLAALPGAPQGVKGSATIAGGTLTLRVSGLPDGSYGVWLYNSLIDSQPLGTGTGPELALDKNLPSDARDYEFVDVSLEPADGNPNHSGQSVLRVPVTRANR